MVCAFTGNRDLEDDPGDVESFDIPPSAAAPGR